MSNTRQKFEKDVQLALSQIVAASHLLAKELLDTAFEGLVPTAQKSAPKRVRKNTVTEGKVYKPRPPEVIAKLEQALMHAMFETAGETMSVLASQVGVSPRELKTPSIRLKKAGRVKAVGQRQHTRYFPMEMAE
jgi:hypothetical protein